MPSVLESSYRPSTGASRLSPTRPFSERSPTSIKQVAHLMITYYLTIPVENT
ncbi:MAG: hypothetical protein LBK82_10355 [Planctomycetaceae bacterium]|nr:hypothetical protein [Planctomycetaceae bacterium]